jgi:hypothetical protein
MFGEPEVKPLKLLFHIALMPGLFLFSAGAVSAVDSSGNDLDRFFSELTWQVTPSSVYMNCKEAMTHDENLSLETGTDLDAKNRAAL